MLEFKNVSFCYQNEEIPMFDNLSFHVGCGEFVSLIGESGCGKSTVLRLINGLESAYQGEIHVASKAAFMPQKDLLFPWKNIKDNVAVPLEIQGVSKKERREQAEELLETVGLIEYKDKFPKDLSGGMRQRVSFARTLITGSDILLLDEPFSALDSLTRMSLQEWLLEKWEEFQKTIIFITHDVEEAIFLSGKIFIMQNRPVSAIEEIIVPMTNPRQRKDLSKEEIQTLKQELIQKLRSDGKEGMV